MRKFSKFISNAITAMIFADLLFTTVKHVMNAKQYFMNKTADSGDEELPAAEVIPTTVDA